MITQKFFFISELGHEIILWILFGISVLGLAVIMERYFFLRAWEKSLLKVVTEIKQAIETSKIHWLEQLPQNLSSLKPDPGIQLIGGYIKDQPFLISQVMHSFILSKKSQFASRLNILATIGTNAPFIGLLGTIFGVMDAFYSLGMASESAAPIVMLGISKALLATAVGLIVAIPAIIAYNFLKRKNRTLIDHFEYILSSLELYQDSLTLRSHIEEEDDEPQKKDDSSPLGKRIM